MQTITWEQFLQNGLALNGKKSSMTVGIFDGVHLGHQSLLKCIMSHNTDFIPVVVTFKENHKAGVRGQGTGNRDIQSFHERLSMFEHIGIQITIVVDFTDEFKHIPGIEFLKLLLNQGSIGFFAVGSDFRCGYKLDTDAEVIQNFFSSNNIPVEIVPELCYPSKGMESGLPISSSRIREAIAAGNIELAQAMLGAGYL
jgi:riboflavin kinase/FMN adenylyltransferase